MLGFVLKKLVNHARKKSPWILHFDVTSCNGCSIEILACLTPRYDIERFGALDKGLPRHADVLLVPGAVSKKISSRLRRIYDQMPRPRVVLAIGSCAISKGVFDGCYNVCGPIDKIIPVDVYVPGCPPKPEAIIDGLIKALALLDKRCAE
jgi:ech hydrogenase subunit C